MQKNTTSSRLKEIMVQRNLKQVDILRLCEPYCKDYGVKLNKNDLSQYVSGKVQPGQDKLSILGLALDISEVWLMGYNLPMNRLDSKLVEMRLSDESKLYNDIQEIYGSDAVQLVHLFSELNNTGKQKALENISDLSDIAKYQK